MLPLQVYIGDASATRAPRLGSLRRARVLLAVASAAAAAVAVTGLAATDFLGVVVPWGGESERRDGGWLDASSLHAQSGGGAGDSVVGRREVAGAVAAWPLGGAAVAAQDDQSTRRSEAERLAAKMAPEELCARCCEFDWCTCATLPALFPQVSSCDCLQYFKAKGYKVPLDARAARAAAGKTEWPAVLGLETANIPRWNIVAEKDLSVSTSGFPDAGKGLFTKVALPSGTVMPPYKGSLLNGEEMARRDKAASDMVWCPVAYMLSSEDAKREPSLCVDARPAADKNPSRYINGAAQASQCQAVNLEQCELGQVMYYRTTRPIPSNTELVTDYGIGYWNDFDGCVSAS